MYIPKEYQWSAEGEIAEFISENPFAIIVNQIDGRIWATHTPIIQTKKKNILFAHIAKANIQWKSFKEDHEVLLIFNGPQSYISSSWYDHESVPTWNYCAVHIYGVVNIVEDKHMYQYMRDFMEHFESTEPHGQKLEDLSEDYVNRELKNIVGFEIEIKEVQAVEKMSQGKNAQNRKRIVQALQQKDELASDAVVKRIKSQE